MFKILRLTQTRKLSKKMLVVLYGKDYWDEVLDLQPLSEWGAINERDLKLLCYRDTPATAFEALKDHLAAPHGAGDDAGDEGAWYRQNARLSRVSRGGSARPGGGTLPRRATIPPARARRRFRQSCAAAGPSRRGCRSAPCRAHRQ